MKTPANGSIVVIDDKPEEGLPLVKALSKNGAPITYFTGLNADELPIEPLAGIRFVFLDIVLGTDGQSNKTKISTAIAVLTRIIGKDQQGPYVLIAWTRHEELIQGIQESLGNNQPLLLLNLEKKDCKDESGNYILKKIERKLSQKLAQTGVFHLFVSWENMVHRSAHETVNEITSEYPRDGDWNEKLWNLLRHLAVAYAGKLVDMTRANDVARNSLLAFNSVFLDTLEHHVRAMRNISGIPVAAVRDIGQQMIARINTKLLTYKGDRSVCVGNLYRTGVKGVRYPKADELFSGKLSDYRKKDSLIPAVSRVAVECSPLCDQAQGKLRAHRILPGLLWPEEHGKVVKTADYIYKSPPMEINGRQFRLVLDIRYLTSVRRDIIASKRPTFRIRRELLVDIQRSVAAHVNRPGVTYLEHLKPG